MTIKQYSKEEKIAYLEEFEKCDKNINDYAKENDIPCSTFRGWLEQGKEVIFGKIQLEQSNIVPSKIRNNTMVFACDNIRIELRENFNKDFLKNIIEVLINAK